MPSKSSKDAPPPVDPLYAVHSPNIREQLMGDSVAVSACNVDIRRGGGLRHQIVHEIDEHGKAQKHNDAQREGARHQDEIFLHGNRMVDAEDGFDPSKACACRAAAVRVFSSS